MGVAMLTEEQANKIKQLAFNCVEATARYSTVSSPSAISKIALVRTKKEFEEYFATLTMKE